VLKPRLKVGTRFLMVLVLIAAPILAVAAVGSRELSSMRDEVNKLYRENIVAGQLDRSLAAGLDDAENVSLHLLLVEDARSKADLEAELHEVLIPAVSLRIAQVQQTYRSDPPSIRAKIRAIVDGWNKFGLLARTDVADAILRNGEGPARAQAATSVVAVLDPITALANQLASAEASDARQALDLANQHFSKTRTSVLVILAILLAIGIGLVTWLTRSVVPPIRRFSIFADRVASGDLSTQLAPTGSDELSDLGRALDEMVRKRRVERDYDATQFEFTQAMQLTESEGEAHELLKRHLERSIPGGTPVVLNRNNSADRLEAMTDIPADLPLRSSLESAVPRSCLAIRFGRPHTEAVGSSSLMSCEICSGCPEFATCTPSLVSGEVIGSLLLSHATPLRETEDRRIRDSVTQAAPVLANLRNLAIAEVRAATDSLTGLPNRRAVSDTMKRMVAQASRTISPLAALLLDLDHFKKINDTYGHGTGDEVLAAVGEVLRATLRESDFAGRLGGEEFLVLLPATDKDGALLCAEKIREAIEKILIAAVERSITVSIGVAGVARSRRGRGESRAIRRSSVVHRQGQREEPRRDRRQRSSR
jgi:diguanylate cyclase (GGDEF)-like protein